MAVNKGFPRFLIAASLGLAILAGAGWLSAQRMEDTLALPTDHPAIKYLETAPKDPVAKLEQRLEKGLTKLDYKIGGTGYLASVLQQLNIPIDSQTLVFSQTSFQARLIFPDRPRAVYFNDNVSVGFVRGGEVME